MTTATIPPRFAPRWRRRGSVASAKSMSFFSPTATLVRATSWTNSPPRFEDADSLAVLDIYAASEAPIEGITGEALARHIREKGKPTGLVREFLCGCSCIGGGGCPAGRHDFDPGRRQRIPAGPHDPGQAAGKRGSFASTPGGSLGSLNASDRPAHKTSQA